MYVYTVLFLLGLMFVRLSSVVMTAWDPFSLIATYATKRNITGSSLEELNYTYFHIMCSFYSAIFAICYLGLTLPSARKIKNFQGTIDCSFTFVVLFGLQMSFVFARYSILMVLVGSLVGAFWSILLVNIAKCISLIGAAEEEFKIIVEQCLDCCKKKREGVQGGPAYARAEIFVY